MVKNALQGLLQFHSSLFSILSIRYPIALLCDLFWLAPLITNKYLKLKKINRETKNQHASKKNARNLPIFKFFCRDSFYFYGAIDHFQGHIEMAHKNREKNWVNITKCIMKTHKLYEMSIIAWKCSSIKLIRRHRPCVLDFNSPSHMRWR